MLRWRGGLALGIAAGVLASIFAATGARAGGGDGGFWGRVQCGDTSKPGCAVKAGSPDRRGSEARRRANVSAAPEACVYRPLVVSAVTEAGLGGRPPGGGRWWTRACRRFGVGGAVVWDAVPVWLAAPPVVSAEALAAEAVSRLDLPEAAVGVSPSGDQLVGLPSWFWVEGASWRPESATASVPGASVTAVATPVRATWSLGDGSVLVCQGPGTRWRPGMDPSAESPDCGYRYRRSSASLPGGMVRVRVVVAWSVRWAGAGGSGTVPGLVTAASRTVRVAESQALLPRSGG